MSRSTYLAFALFASLSSRPVYGQPAVEAERRPAPTAAPSGPDEPMFGAAGEPATAPTPVQDQRSIDGCLRDHAASSGLPEIQEAALEHAMASRRHVAAVLKKATRKGLLPTVYVLGMYGGSSASSDGTMQDYTYRSFPWKEKTDVSSAGNRGYVGVVLSFDLGKTVLGLEELEAIKVSEFRNTLLEKVTSLYYGREKVVLDLCTHERPEARRRELELKIRELSSLLEALEGRTERSSAKDATIRPSGT